MTLFSDTLQLGICLGKHDLNACLNQIEANLEVVHQKDKYTRIQAVIERLLFLAFDSQSVRDVRRSLNRNLKDYKLKVVALNSLQFPDKDDDTEDVILIDDDRTEASSSKKNNNNNNKKQQQKKVAQPPIEQTIDHDDDDEEDFVEENDASSSQLSDFIDLLAHFVSNKLEQGSVLNFDHMIKLEQAVLQDDSFNFMEFLMRHKYLFEQRDLSIVLIGDSVNSSGSEDLQASPNSKRASTKFKQDCLIAHIRQLTSGLETAEWLTETQRLEFIELAIRSFYSITRVEQYGAGTLESLLQTASHAGSQDQALDCVRYEQAVLSNRKQPLRGNSEISINSLVQKLTECPLLENVADYLDWYGHGGYSSKLGDLKEYLTTLNGKNLVTADGGFFSVHVLETQPSHFLKLTKNTSIEHVKKAVEAGDFVNASGHLVSLIAVQYKSLNRTPHALLVNEIQSALSALLAKCSTATAQHDDIDTEVDWHLATLNGRSLSSAAPLNSSFLTFICELIHRVPVNMHAQLLFDFIIDPLVNLTNDRQIKTRLFQFVVAKAFVFYNRNSGYVASDAKVGVFLKIGARCSISEWSRASLDSMLATLSDSHSRQRYAMVRERSALPKQTSSVDNMDNFEVNFSHLI
jgi:hypothetical protein